MPLLSLEGIHLRSVTATLAGVLGRLFISLATGRKCSAVKIKNGELAQACIRQEQNVQFPRN